MAAQLGSRRSVVVDLTVPVSVATTTTTTGPAVLSYEKPVPEATVNASAKDENKHAKYVFTKYFTTDADAQNFLEVIEGMSKYAMAGLETCPTTGRQHLQGFMWLNDRSRFAAVRKQIPGVHIAVMKGSLEQNEAYCSKEDKTPWVCGERPLDNGLREKNRWIAIRDQAKTGDVENVEDAQAYVVHYSSLKLIAKDHAKAPADLDDCCGVWVYGPSGSGKTHLVIHTYTTPDTLFKKAMNKWWCGYRGEPNVLLDDIDCTHAPFMAYFLKTWADKYSIRVETKNGGAFIRPSRVYVTSNFTIDEVFGDRDDLAAIKRRFEVVHVPFPRKLSARKRSRMTAAGTLEEDVSVPVVPEAHPLLTLAHHAIASTQELTDSSAE